MAGVGTLSGRNLLALSADPAGVTAGYQYWNTTLEAQRVYDGSVWKTIHSSTIGPTAPTSPGTEELWFDTNEPDVWEMASQGTSTPTVPAAGLMKLWARSRGGRVLPAVMGPSGMDALLQPLLVTNGTQIYIPVENATANTIIGGPAVTATGTATAATFTAPTTSTAAALHLSAKRIDYLVTTAATTAVAGWRQARNTFAMSSAAKMGGFFMVARFSPATGGAVATRRLFCGVSSSTSAPTDVQPSSLTNALGVGYDAADTNWQIFNAGSVAGGKTNTGIARPSTDRPGIYEVSIFCPPGSLTPTIEFADLFAGSRFQASFSAGTGVPANGTALSARGWASVGGTNNVIGFTAFGTYVETDF